MLSDLCFRPRTAHAQDDIHLVQVDCTYENKPVKALNLSYYGGVAQDYTYVNSGVCDLVLYLSPPLPREYAIKLEVEYADIGAMVQQDDLMALHKVFRERKIAEAWHTVRIPIPGGELYTEPPSLPESSIRSGHRITPEPGRVTLPPAEEIVFEPKKGILVVPGELEVLWPMPILVLSQPELKHTQTFLTTLQVYQRNHEIRYSKIGPGPLRADGMDVYVTLATPDSVITTLHCTDDGYHDVRSDVHYSSLKEPMGDIREAMQIWIGIPNARH